MERVFKFVFALTLIASISACSQSHKEAMYAEDSSIASETPISGAMATEESQEAMSPNQALSSSAAVENGDSKRKFIRTADLRFKTPDVIQSTYSLEEITVRHGGFVTNSQLASDINSVDRVDVTKDSTMVITYYTVNAYLTLRVPNFALDTTLKDLRRFVDFLDYRTITANDVALSLLANDLTQQRLSKNEKRLQDAIDNRGRKLAETTSAEELLLRTQERADHAKISNLSLADQVEFSTITIHLYENQRVKKELVAKRIESKSLAYKPSLGSRLIEGLNGGWGFFCDFLVVCSYLWWVFVLAICGIIGLRWFKKRRKKN